MVTDMHFEIKSDWNSNINILQLLIISIYYLFTGG